MAVYGHLNPAICGQARKDRRDSTYSPGYLEGKLGRIVYGTRLYGKSDCIEGLGHVATRFAHIWFIPLFPIAGFFVLEGEEDRGMEIPMRGKSVLAGYLRAATLVGGLVMAGLGLSSMGYAVVEGVGLLVAGLVSLALFIGSYWFYDRMSDERRMQLLSDTGLLEVMLEQHRLEEQNRPAPAWPVNASEPAAPAAAEPAPFAEYGAATPQHR